jgi:hypothetical protein
MIPVARRDATAVERHAEDFAGYPRSVDRRAGARLLAQGALPAPVRQGLVRERSAAVF